MKQREKSRAGEERSGEKGKRGEGEVEERENGRAQ